MHHLCPCRNALSRQSVQKGFHGLCSCVVAPCLPACPFTGIHSLRGTKLYPFHFPVSVFASNLPPWPPYLFFAGPYFWGGMSFWEELHIQLFHLCYHPGYKVRLRRREKEVKVRQRREEKKRERREEKGWGEERKRGEEKGGKKEGRREKEEGGKRIRRGESGGMSWRTNRERREREWGEKEHGEGLGVKSIRR